MSIIGNFEKQDDSYVGTIRTLTLNTKATMRSVEKVSDKAPDYRVFAGAVEIGAAWSTVSKAEKPYLSVKLDDPSFAQPVQCRLITQDKGFTLVWSR